MRDTLRDLVFLETELLQQLRGELANRARGGRSPQFVGLVGLARGHAAFIKEKCCAVKPD